MRLDWEQTDEGVLRARSRPFTEYMSLQTSWNDAAAENARLFALNPWNTVLARQVREQELRHDRALHIDPEIEFRISNDGFKVPRFTGKDRIYEPLKRIELFLHMTPTVPLTASHAGREILSLAALFRFETETKEKATGLCQMLADILPGTAIANPNWVLDLDYRLCIDRSDLHNILIHPVPVEHVRECIEDLEDEFLLALGAAQEARSLTLRPDFGSIVSPLGIVEEPRFKKAFDALCATPHTAEDPERRRALMVQNALMNHILNESTKPKSAPEKSTVSAPLWKPS
ncbi:MAG TPA: hypothetical protein PKX87_04395 [Alphaproteobacteria bacterium]|nr:hypothetical protein [Alphaproteobacteria bacterium]